MSAGSDVEVVSLRGRVERLEAALERIARHRSHIHDNGKIGIIHPARPDWPEESFEDVDPHGLIDHLVREAERALSTPQGVPHD